MKLEQGRISTLEATLLVSTLVLPTAVATLPPGMIGQARAGAWLSALLVTLYGILIATLAAVLSQRFPGQTLLEIMSGTWGFVGRWIIGGLYVFWLIHTTSLIARSVTDFLIIKLLPRTPMIVIVATFFLVVLYAARGGIEILGRLSLLLLPLVLISILVIGILSLQDLDVHNLALPLSEGLAGIVRGAFAPAGIFGEVILGTVAIFPFLNRPQEALKAGIYGNLITGATLVLVLLLSLMVLGAAAAAADEFSFIRVTRFVSVAEFLERIDALFVLAWVFAMGVKLMLWFYASVLTGAQWLGLADYRPVTLPFAIIAVGLSIFQLDSIAEFRQWVAVPFTPFMTVLELLIPLAMLISVWWRWGRTRAGKRRASGTSSSRAS